MGSSRNSRRGNFTPNYYNYSSKIEKIKVRASRKVENYDRHYNLAAEQVTHHSKWLTATLAGANGAGLIALTNASRLSNDAVSLVALWLGCGLIMAMLSGTALQELYNQITGPILDLSNFWSDVSIDGEINQEQLNKLENSLKRMMKLSWLPPLLGWISGIFFLSGVGVFVNNLK